MNARPFSLKSATVKAHTVNKQPILFLLLIIAIVQLAEGGRNDDVMALMVVVGMLMPINGSSRCHLHSNVWRTDRLFTKFRTSYLQSW